MVANLTQNFPAAAAWSRKMRDTFLAPYFYRKYSVDGRYVFVDKSACSTILQKELAIDTIMQREDGSICIEEKIEQRYTGNFALETESCTVVGREREGWMHYAKADYLLYAFAYEHDNGLQFWLIDFPKLREWFWNLPVRYEAHVMEHTINHTRFEKVPIRDVVKAVPTAHYIVNHQGCTFMKKRASA